MASTDPLLLLRSALSSNAKITLLAFPEGSTDPSAAREVFSLPESTHLSLPSQSSHGQRTILPKETPTRFTRGAGMEDTFDLQALLFVFLQRDQAPTEYMRSARDTAITFVSITERRSVIDWLAAKVGIEGPEGRIKPLAGSKRDGNGQGVGDGATQVHGIAAAGDGDPDAQVVKRQRYVPNKKDQERVKELSAIMDGPSYGTQGATDNRIEKLGGSNKTRETVLRGDRLNNFESLRLLAGPRLKLMRDEIQKGVGATGVVSQRGVAPGSGMSQVKPKKKPLNPIIIISPSSTALITMHNVKRFLEDSAFETSSESRMKLGGEGGRLAEDVIVINHARTTTSISATLSSQNERKARYFVVDSVDALSKFGGPGGLDEAWERVVCVMTTGQEWQFRPYKWSDPKDLFHHVKGIFWQWTNEPPNPKVNAWNVTTLKIDPAKRHIDKATVADFWRSLEGWIAMHKPWLTV